MQSVIAVVLLAQVLIVVVGVVFHIINSERCKKHLPPIGYGPYATCKDMRTHDDLFYRHPRHGMPAVQKVFRRQ